MKFPGSALGLFRVFGCHRFSQTHFCLRSSKASLKDSTISINAFLDQAVFALQASVLDLLVQARLRNRLAEPLQPLVQRMRTYAQSHGNFPIRIPPHRDLMYRIPLELVVVIACLDVGLLASKLGGRASTNLGAHQFRLRELL